MPIYTATFHDAQAADAAVDALLAAGYSPDDISLLVSNNTRERFFPEQDGGLDHDTAHGAVAGGVAGGLGVVAGGLALCAVTGGLAAPLMAAGPLAVALSGGATGAAVGSLVGGLIGAGVSEPVAAKIDQGVREGALLVAVRADAAEGPRIDAILARGAISVQAPTDGPVPPLP